MLPNRWAIALTTLTLGCKESTFQGGDATVHCESGIAACKGGDYYTCDESGQWQVSQECSQRLCDEKLGCIECQPGHRGCDGNDVLDCASDGTWTAPIDQCDPLAGFQCHSGECRNACELAEQSQSYIGCEYWPTVTLNDGIGYKGGAFDFAVAVGNPNSVPVSVDVEIGGVKAALAMVEPGNVAAIILPYILELQLPIISQLGGNGYDPSTLLPHGAYRLTSTLPVTVYQFNPIQYQVGESLSISNDASLLLPTSVLGTEYLGITRPTFILSSGSIMAGFLSIVAVEDDTEITITSSAYTTAGAGIPALEPGQEHVVNLMRGTVLQILSAQAEGQPLHCAYNGVGDSCEGERTADLTGTRIVSNHPVQLIGGHGGTFVPFDRWAADHLEETIFPLLAWGQSLLALSTDPQVKYEPNVWKVVSGSDENTIVFEPPVHDPVTLSAGEFIEFEHQGGFRVDGTGRIAVAQFMVGDDYNGRNSEPDMGDPSMGLGIPYEQYRTSYDFLTPDTYTKSFVNVVALIGAEPTLDGKTISALTPIAKTGYGFARVEVQPGAHHIESLVDPQGFGITVSGIAPYTSYLYPGGLDLAPIPVE